MDKNEVKLCLRAVLSSSPAAYTLNALLNDFRKTTGCDLPLFGYRSPLEFLQTLDDTVQVFGNHYNPTVYLVESRKSSHITSLVDRQRSHKNGLQPRIILPSRNIEWQDYRKTDEWKCSEKSSYQNYKPKKSYFNVTPNSCDFKKTAIRENYMNKSHVEKDLSCEFKKTEISCFKDIVSCGDGRINSSTTSYGSVNDGIKNKLRTLIKKHPNGLWCCELPNVFLMEFNFVLDYREFGYTSMIQMVSELPDVFRCVRPGKEDWILFDASMPPTAEEQKMINLYLNGSLVSEIKVNLCKLLDEYCQTKSGRGLELNSLSNLYESTFGTPLDFWSLGFQDLKSFLGTLEGSVLKIVEIDDKLMVAPLESKFESTKWEEAVPPITADNDIFADIFPLDVVGPNESYEELDLRNHVAVGQRVEVCVAEVWSPHRFYLQLHKFKNRLNRLMDDLQNFYDVHLKKYKMPDVTIRPKQVCVGLYNACPEHPDEWHRGQIVRVINEKTVLVNFVDYGTEARVKKSHLRFLYRAFRSFPVQAFRAELAGVLPAGEEDKWPHSVNKTFLEYLQQSPYLEAQMMEIDFKQPCVSVIMFDMQSKTISNINRKLVLENLAKVKDTFFEEMFKAEEESEREKTVLKIPEKAEATSANSSGVFEVPEGDDEFSWKRVTETGDERDAKSNSSPQYLYWNYNRKTWDTSSLNDSIKSQKKETNENPIFEDFEELEDIIKSETEGEVKSGPFVEVDSRDEVTEIEKGLEGISVSLAGPAVEAAPMPPPETTKRLPPGLETFNSAPDLDQIKMLLMEKEDMKRRTNMLAVELMVSNPNIKQVALSDTRLALMIATEMAEAYITSAYTSKLSMCYMDAFRPNGIPVTAKEPPQSTEFEVSTSGSPATDTNVPSSPSTQEIKKYDFIKEMKVGKKKIHVVKIEEVVYVCVEEIINLFTLISNREVADRILHIKRINMKYKVLDKNSDGSLFKALKSLNLPGVNTKKNVKTKIYLLPSENVVTFLQTLGYLTDSFEIDIMELKKAFEEEFHKM